MTLELLFVSLHLHECSPWYITGYIRSYGLSSANYALVRTA